MAKRMRLITARRFNRECLLDEDPPPVAPTPGNSLPRLLLLAWRNIFCSFFFLTRTKEKEEEEEEEEDVFFKRVTRIHSKHLE